MAKNKLEIQYRSENLNYWMFTLGIYGNKGEHSNIQLMFWD